MQYSATDSPPMPETIASASAATSTLFLGHTGEWWDFSLIVSVLFAALAAGAVGIATAGSIISHKRETIAAEASLRAYKLTVDGKVADAKKEGIEAGKAAGDALLRAAALEKQAAELRAANLVLETKVAPRRLTQAQQNELSSLLTKVDRQIGTITTSPMTPESEWFMRVLTAPLKSAGWEIEMRPGTVEPTILQPTGVVIGYAMDPTNPRVDPLRSKAADALAAYLSEVGVSATVVPALLQPPQTIAITITPR